MSACCHADSNRQSPSWTRRAREFSAWALPGAVLVLMPKCPMCLAAYLTLWTGLGLSLTTASYLRLALLFLSIASLLFLIVNRFDRIQKLVSNFRKETRQCHTK